MNVLSESYASKINESFVHSLLLSVLTIAIKWFLVIKWSSLAPQGPETCLSLITSIINHASDWLVNRNNFESTNGKAEF